MFFNRYFNVNSFKRIVYIQILMQYIHCGELIPPSENWAEMVSGGERLDLLGTPLSLVQLQNYLWRISTYFKHFSSTSTRIELTFTLRFWLKLNVKKETALQKFEDLSVNSFQILYREHGEDQILEMKTFWILFTDVHVTSGALGER